MTKGLKYVEFFKPTAKSLPFYYFDIKTLEHELVNTLKNQVRC
jgi:hypothetical protein